MEPNPDSGRPAPESATTAEMPKKRSPGRPRKRPSDLRSNIVHARITDGELRALRMGAKKAGLHFSDFIRLRMVAK